MQYDTLVSRIAYLSRQPELVVRDVLYVIPDALLDLTEGDKVRTPLGVFRMVRKIGRKVKLPGSDIQAQLVERLQVRLSAGVRLKKAT